MVNRKHDVPKDRIFVCYYNRKVITVDWRHRTNLYKGVWNMLET